MNELQLIVWNLMVSKAEYALIFCVYLYKALDSKCHELKSTIPKFDGVCFSYISPKSVVIQKCLKF